MSTPRAAGLHRHRLRVAPRCAWSAAASPLGFALMRPTAQPCCARTNALARVARPLQDGATRQRVSARTRGAATADHGKACPPRAAVRRHELRHLRNQVSDEVQRRTRRRQAHGARWTLAKRAVATRARPKAEPERRDRRCRRARASHPVTGRRRRPGGTPSQGRRRIAIITAASRKGSSDSRVSFIDEVDTCLTVGTAEAARRSRGASAAAG
jgi:hypothetical protein